MKRRKKIGLGLLTVSVFLVAYAWAATLTSTRVGSSVNVIAQSSVALQDASGNKITLLDFGSIGPGASSIVSGTLIYNSNEAAQGYIDVSTEGLPVALVFTSPQNGSLISAGTPLSISFSVKSAAAAPPGPYSWTVIVSISDTAPGG